MSRKYPRTPHLPWSAGATSDDVRAFDISEFSFEGQEVVVTEKMDGECTTIHCEGIHARSLSYTRHPSRDHVRALYAKVVHSLGSVDGSNLRICGENLWAVHSIAYDALPAHFLVFGIYEHGVGPHGQPGMDVCLSWENTVDLCGELGLKTVPVLYKGLWNRSLVEALYTGESTCGGVQEGYVVRLAREFDFEDFAMCVAKFVRKDHVQTDAHWLSKSVVRNRLRS